MQHHTHFSGAGDRAVKAFGRLDILVNNAGVLAVGPLEYFSLEDELLERIENRARAQGLKTLFVLTTRTAHWFRERGFEALRDRKSTRLNSSHYQQSRMPSSA